MKRRVACLRKRLRFAWDCIVIGFTSPEPPPLPRTMPTACDACPDADRCARAGLCLRSPRAMSIAWQMAPSCCLECDDARRTGLSIPDNLTGRRMIVCPTCGNKRCPHATSHHHACTGSNAPGQPGSAFT
jgi:hypothetical protein